MPRRALSARKYKGLLYVLPWIVGLLIFQLYPFIYSLVLSFTDKSMAAQTDFVGLDNYLYMFTKDRDFPK
ncbi:MAG: sugar ABC transporter permease, partial [Clostridia bacterium]